MARVIEVELEKLIPHNAFVYEINLRRARERWDQKSYKDKDGSGMAARYTGFVQEKA
jgi:hypothetical protein